LLGAGEHHRHGADKTERKDQLSHPETIDDPKIPVPSLRLITWNCRSGSVTARLAELAPHAPDVVFVQECAPTPSLGPHRQVLTRSINRSKGIALGSLNPAYRLAELKRRRGSGKAAIASAVAGPVPFTALGIWSQGPGYADDAIRSLDAYARRLRSGPAVVMGDLNSGTCLHRKESPSRNHRRLIDALAGLGLVSAYHAFHRVEHGRETHATYRHQFKTSQPWHIDFCFVPAGWVEHLVDVQVLDDAWSLKSDHVPLKVDLRLP
jgi:endonuclease/exonuclease/phosphatase family metal-dependent hydrolase